MKTWKTHHRFILILELLFLALLPSSLYSQKPELVLPINHYENIFQVSFSPNGQFALSGSIDKTLILWIRIQAIDSVI